MNTYVISDEDLDSILEFLSRYPPFISSEVEQIALLKKKLRDAVIIPKANLSPTTISINSTAKVVDLEVRETRLYTLVYPHQANAGLRRLSILSPLGAALLGRSEGDFFECAIKGRPFAFAVREVLPNQHSSFNIRS